MEQNSYDVIVIGAGAAGLIAGWELVQVGKKVAVIEARNRVGGRIHTIQDSNFAMPIELGAEFVHGKLEPTQLLLKKANAEYYKVSGEIWEKQEGQLKELKDFVEDYSDLNKKFDELKTDLSVASFIHNYLVEDKYEDLRFTLKNYVEGYYAGDTSRVSTFALREEMTTSDDVQFRVEGGYEKLVNFLYNNGLEKGCTFFLNNPVQSINWRKDQVVVETDNQKFKAKKVLITVPIGVLQSEKINFTPAINSKIDAIKQLGYGPAIKTILQFEDNFWANKELTQQKDLSKLSFIFSDAIIPTWWTQYPKKIGIITGWSGGPFADRLKGLEDPQIVQEALRSLSYIFNIDLIHLQQKLKGWQVANWSNDPYSCGAYSYQVVNGSTAIRIAKEPIEQTIFFAGEGLYDNTQIGTVNAALVTGRETAHQIIASF